MEWGSPIGSMYLLGNPDHYTNYTFTPFYWKSFVQEVRKPWEPQDIPLTWNILQPECDLNGACPDPPQKPIEAHDQPKEKVAIFKHNGWVIGLSPVHDYVCRPLEFESMCLYDWISWYQHEKKTVEKNQSPSAMTVKLKQNQTAKPFWMEVGMHLSSIYKQSQSQNFISSQEIIHSWTLMVYVGQVEYKSQTSLEKPFHVVTESFIVLLCSHCSAHGEAN